MATKTLGTVANNSLTALTVAGSMVAADLATIRNGIKDDQINGQPISPGAFNLNGLLYVPNRGVLKCIPGDVVAFDTVTGWPILVSALAISAGSSKWTLT